MIKTYSYAAQKSTDKLAPFQIERRDPGADDVQIDILFCGVCHSDLHTARNEWNNTLYPSVPGHEIVGKVTAVGANVKNFKVGDLAGVGCMVDSCQHCASCAEGDEQYCENGFTGTYNGPVFGGENTFGGYSDKIVVKEKFVLKISHSDNLAAVAPLLCAGITTYSPLHHWKVGPGKKVGVVGLGGLGHMAVKIAHAMGAHVVLFTTSPNKREDGLRLGADEVVVSRDPKEMATQTNKLDFILNTVAAPHDLDAVPQPAQARRHHDPGGCTGSSASIAFGVQPDLQAPQPGGLVDRRRKGNPGDAGFLREARHRLGHRDDPHEGHQRGL
jgi:uncharacterized zinc-type alcohol dehydrogenase-like protein